MKEYSKNISRPNAHELGDYGERFVLFRLPSAWVIHQYKGSEDYGLDFHVEVFVNGKPTGLEFGIQVKTTDRKISSISHCKLTKNNLSYIAGKPYPTMIVVVSHSEDKAIYTWIQESLTPIELTKAIRNNNSRLKLRIPLHPVYVFNNVNDEIISFLRKRDGEIQTWIATTAHTYLLINIYLDIHAALDALIECISVIHRNDRTEDEVSHKATFTFIITVSAYGCLYLITRPERNKVLGPIAPIMEAMRNQYRAILSEMISEQQLVEIENNDKDPIMIIHASTEPFFPSVPRLTSVLRDILRTISVFMVPSRNFNMQMSGLAKNIIDYNK
jgi:hypothetical protein